MRPDYQYAMSSMDSYERQGDAHTVLDRKITQEEVELTQARMNNVSRSLAKVFNLGKNWGDSNSTRCWNNVSTESCVVPLMYPSPKVHKDPDSLGDPKTRPVVQANTCITSRLSTPACFTSTVPSYARIWSRRVQQRSRMLTYSLQQYLWPPTPPGQRSAVPALQG